MQCAYSLDNAKQNEASGPDSNFLGQVVWKPNNKNTASGWMLFFCCVLTAVFSCSTVNIGKPVAFASARDLEHTANTSTSLPVYLSCTS